jgi:hypothetical protein
MTLINQILSENLIEAKKELYSRLRDILERRFVELKKQYMAESFATVFLDEARIKIVRARIRNGKIQRRKKVSNVKGYTMRKKGSGPARLTRMSPMERRRRKMGQRRGKIKRRAKRVQIRLKTKRSLNKRRSLGLR